MMVTGPVSFERQLGESAALGSLIAEDTAEMTAHLVDSTSNPEKAALLAATTASMQHLYACVQQQKEQAISSEHADSLEILAAHADNLLKQSQSKPEQTAKKCGCFGKCTIL